MFSRIATRVSDFTGSPLAFFLALLTVIVWAVVIELIHSIMYLSALYAAIKMLIPSSITTPVLFQSEPLLLTRHRFDAGIDSLRACR